MSSRETRIRFEGGDGTTRVGELVRPLGRPRAWAIFAHCFACSRQSHAARRVADALALAEIGCLRFDFAGVGASAGELTASGFSGQVGDLQAAARFVEAEVGQPVRLLVGHSLGGAAVLAAAGDLAEVAAVATIAAPASPAHLALKFAADGETLPAGVDACLDVAGQRICIDQRFLDELRAHDLARNVATLKRPLLLLHGPRDAVVGIDEAGALFRAAKHPKSFVSLDDADHLLTAKADAAYAAGVIAAWAERYLPKAAERVPAEGAVDVRETGAGGYVQEVHLGRHRLVADEPESVGGLDAGPSPYDLLAAALGVCTSMTIRMYADRKGWPLAGVRVAVRHAKVHKDDSGARDAKIDRLTRAIHLEGPLDAAQRSRLVEVADRCPVHRTLERANEVVTHLEEDG
ncbi:MAG: alpha/beta fold hydrolase [Alphaproteobacteria bacterium]